MMEEEVYVIRKEGFQEILGVKVHEKGLITLIRFSTERELSLQLKINIKTSFTQINSFFLLFLLKST